MSPHSSSGSERSVSSPYPSASRRASTSGQPKASGRLQYSACGACRMRRVRCDLKDWPVDTAGPHPACSNCTERSIKCVDEFAEVKAVKQLRRGRRLQQVEATYGKASNDGQETVFSGGLPRGQTSIPSLQPSFFKSTFWRWFSQQRPIIEPSEFPARFLSHAEGANTLNKEGCLLALLIVVWASTFGVDEHGAQDDEFESLAAHSNFAEPTFRRITRQSSAGTCGNSINTTLDRSSELGQRRLERKQKTETMIKEILQLLDIQGVMRQPTIDGVRVLLLLLPILQEFPTLEKRAISESAYGQARAFTDGNSISVTSGNNAWNDDIVRARVGWYAHVSESITTCLRGEGRLILDEEDFYTFTSAISSAGLSNSSGPNTQVIMTSSVPTPMSPSFSSQPQNSTTSPAYLHFPASDAYSLPLQIAAACRKIHSALTSAAAKRRAEKRGSLDIEGVHTAWTALEACWDEVESARMNCADEAFELEKEALLSSWQIFLFECHNVIREFLKQHLMPFPSSAASPRVSTKAYATSEHLYTLSIQKCLDHLPSVLNIIQSHLLQGERSGVGANIFKFDSGLVTDGCFFAGVLAATKDTDSPRSPNPQGFKQEDVDRGVSFTAEESVHICLTALGEIRWAFSNAQEREKTLKMIWQQQESRRHQQTQYQQLQMDAHSSRAYHQRQAAQSYVEHAQDMSVYNNDKQHVSSRPFLPALNLSSAPSSSIDSAPNTSSSTGSSSAGSGWPSSSFSRPSTGSSVGTDSDSPQYSHFPGSNPCFKGSTPQARDVFYHIPENVEPFTYAGPMSDALIQGYNNHSGSSTHHSQLPTHSGYLDPTVIYTSSSVSANTCGAHFDSGGFYQ